MGLEPNSLFDRNFPHQRQPFLPYFALVDS